MVEVVKLRLDGPLERLQRHGRPLLLFEAHARQSQVQMQEELATLKHLLCFVEGPGNGRSGHVLDRRTLSNLDPPIENDVD